MNYLLDFDMTICDTSALKKYRHWKEAQKHIEEIKIFDKAIEFINKVKQKGDSVFIVSGNVGSTIKKAIDHFNIPISKENVFGYKWGYPTDNFKRKIMVITDALNVLKSKENVLYIGDEYNDLKACNELGIKFEFEKFSK